MDKHTPIRVNYLYFGFFFATLLLIYGGSVLLRENLSGSRLFFILYAAGQAILEVGLFIFLGSMARRILGLSWFFLFIGGTFVFFVLHLFDFLTERILDLSIYETILTFILEETYEQLFFLLDASGVPVWIWMLAFAILGVLPLIGIGIYQATEYLSLKKPCLIRREWFLLTFFCIPAALILWDYSASNMIHPNIYTSFIQSLPWKFTFLRPETAQLSLNGPPIDPNQEEAVLSMIEQNSDLLESKPNIYLFIVESLREDFITEKIAPHLTQFKKENIHFKMALSNANGTNMSWFSLFHSQFPYYWNRLQKEGWEMGSPALALLKKWGYQIRVISSAQLEYFGMQELMFGRNNYLLDSCETYHHAAEITAADSDQMTLNNLQKQITENPSLQTGQLFIIFWDSTHFDYSWPQTEPPPFTPVADQMAYFRAFHSKTDLEYIKNRYRNAIHFIDRLFGQFLEFLPKKEEAVVVITGDHGEEFFEHGHIFHGSHLNHEQTNIPLYFRFGSKERVHLDRKVVTPMDIFPSIIDYLGEREFPILQGESIFRTSRWPFALIARFNACRSPYEFCLHNGEHKVIFQFNNRKNIFRSDQLQIRSVCCCKDKIRIAHEEDLEAWIDKEFGAALDRLFQRRPMAAREAALKDLRSDPFPPFYQPLCP